MPRKTCFELLGFALMQRSLGPIPFYESENRSRAYIRTYGRNCSVLVLQCYFDNLFGEKKCLHVLFHVQACQLQLHETGNINFGPPNNVVTLTPYKTSLQQHAHECVGMCKRT